MDERITRKSLTIKLKSKEIHPGHVYGALNALQAAIVDKKSKEDMFSARDIAGFNMLHPEMRTYILCCYWPKEKEFDLQTAGPLSLEK